jgi:alpha-glucosidase (family GH31 glycosyl hydrolase)
VYSSDLDGIDTLIPSAIVQGLIGHPYICPDMIGGGEWTVKQLYSDRIDEELFIRMAQCSALFPMMQFSWAPWEAVSGKALKIIHEAAELHCKMADEIIAVINDVNYTGEPVLRSLEYYDPHRGYEQIKDEFMIGENILAAPVVVKGMFKKEVVFPKGRWKQDDNDTVYEGNNSYLIDSPLEKLLWFRRVEGEE